MLSRRDKPQLLRNLGPNNQICSGAIFEETITEITETLPPSFRNFILQHDYVNQCDYFCCVNYYWMETDPDYEFEAPKWFDFTADFDEEVNDDWK